MAETSVLIGDSEVILNEKELESYTSKDEEYHILLVNKLYGNSAAYTYSVKPDQELEVYSEILPCIDATTNCPIVLPDFATEGISIYADNSDACSSGSCFLTQKDDQADDNCVGNDIKSVLTISVICDPKRDIRIVLNKGSIPKIGAALMKIKDYIKELCHELFLFERDIVGILICNQSRMFTDYKSLRNELNLVQNKKMLVMTQKISAPEPGPPLEDSEVKLKCKYCDYISTDPTICKQCRRVRNTSPPPGTSSEQEESTGRDSSSDTSTSARSERHRKSPKKRKCTRKLKKPKPPENTTVEVVVVSDDDECAYSNGIKLPKPKTNIFTREPLITQEEEFEPTISLRGGGVEMESLLDSPDIEKIRLGCRTVRFGSYKVVPQDKIVLTEHGLKLKVPTLSKSGSTTVIKILMKDIVKVFIHFGQAAQHTSASAPAIFYYITHNASKRIRDALHMTSKNKVLYFDPTSKEELHKRITLLPENVNNTERLFLKSIYEARCLMEELTWDEANDILVRAAPKEVQHTLKKETSSVKAIAPTAPPNSDIKIIMFYPPATGGLSINTEDYRCLIGDQFLNDVIIDFYLKYLWLNILSDEDRKRTHIFSSFFYKRLTMSTKNSGQDKLSAAEKRHARVKSWTKSENIFEKDFIIIPINEKAHWFLGVICFPYLTGPVRMSDNTPVPNVPRKTKGASVLAGGQVPAKIWGTTISLVKQEERYPTRATINLEPEEEKEESDRDEAEADDDDMEPNTTEEESGNDEELMDEATPRVSKVKPNLEAIKQPCILIFDSLACSSRSRVCATLREYLQVEWKAKHKGVMKDFSKDVFKGAVPKVPQQPNYTDCGIYLLQYVEAFFKRPITDYRMPIRSIKDWFLMEDVSNKRYDIMQLLLSIMREQNVDIAQLNLPSPVMEQASPLYDDGEEDDDVMDGEHEFHDEEEAMEEEEEEEHLEEEDDYEEENFSMIARYKAKRFEQQHREQSRLEHIATMEEINIPRVEPSPRLERLGPSPRQSPRRFNSPSPRLDIRSADSIRAEIRAEPIRVEQPMSKPRLPDSVTICEPNSKRKLPLSLQDIRNPRLSSPQIEKIKKMRTE